ncbi:MAG: hypothetical protein U5K79_18210 [Cyclobacteriaceae bacterium]|nr:hypothetical protein [Cyclobacteriaceae bacterium]
MSFQTEDGADRIGLPIVQSAYNYLAIVPKYDIAGYWAASDKTSNFGSNPVASQQRKGDGYDYNDFRVTGNTFVEFDFLKNFTFKTNVGIDIYNSPSELYQYTLLRSAQPQVRATD